MSCENICDSPKLNVWCGLFHDRDIGPFILEHSITGAVYLGMIENFVMRQIEDLNEDVIFITTVHHQWSCNVRYFLDQKMPGRWIGRDGPIPWPPRSPAIIPLDFFFVGLCQGQCLSFERGRLNRSLFKNTIMHCQYHEYC